MNATVHTFPTLESAFHLARCVLQSPAYDDEAVQAAIEVLACSNDPADIATVRLLRHRAWAIDGGEFPQDWPETINGDTPSRMRWIGIALVVMAALALAVMLERHWTEANAAAIERIV